ncbi:MAG TPA: hypothetical protein VFP50_14380 [Anaeromyxobacteraceae bacterium]|nr:hypothetical protein [Anaeromyxobacteraceae bacterium]
MIRPGRRDVNLARPYTPEVTVSPTTTTRYQDLCTAFEEARKRFSDYRSDCVFFAATFARGLADYLGGPRELVAFEPVGGVRVGDGPTDVKDAMHLDEDTYWHFGVRLRITSDKVTDAIPLRIRFKKIEGRYVVNLFGHEDFELAEPTPAALQPVYHELFTSVRRHYEDGLRLFLDKRGQNLHIAFTAARQAEIAGG